MRIQETRVFCNPKVISRGWYWALPSRALGSRGKQEIRIFGKKLLLYRGESGNVYCIEAHCPHMGAHFKEGRIEGELLRCGFHGWKFSGSGKCVEIPSCSANAIKAESVVPKKAYLAKEKFGMIWIHSDPEANSEMEPLPSFSALEGKKTVSWVDQAEIRNCHPTLILGGGVDEEHFEFVHSGTTASSGLLKFTHESVSPAVIRFSNQAKIMQDSFLRRLMSWVYQGVLKYDVTYWYASTALAELGPPILPLYSIFAYRPLPDGRTEGLNIYVTPFRKGPVGWLISRLAIYLTRKILRKGGSEDTPIQNSIQFEIGPHTFNNAPFRAFFEYVERQPIQTMSAVKI